MRCRRWRATCGQVTRCCRRWHRSPKRHRLRCRRSSPGWSTRPGWAATSGVALEETAARMDSKDMTWVAQAIMINRQTGGNLAEVLDQVGATIRERGQIKRQVQALSAEGKLSAYVLMALPSVWGPSSCSPTRLPAQVRGEPVRLRPDRHRRDLAGGRRTVAAQSHHDQVLRREMPTQVLVAIGAASLALPLLAWALFSRPSRAQQAAVSNLQRGLRSGSRADQCDAGGQRSVRWRCG